MDTLINGAILVGILLAIVIPVGLIGERNRRRKIEAAFANREPLPEQTFYERYFQSQGVPFFIVTKVRQILEEELDADLSRLSAEDDFNRNLSFFFDYDSWANIEIVVRLEKEFQINIANAEAQATHTVRDIVHLVWTKLRQRAA